MTYAEAAEKYQITRATVYALTKRYMIVLKRTAWGHYTGKKKTSESSSSEASPSS
jgi:hypothetical protein